MAGRDHRRRLTVDGGAASCGLRSCLAAAGRRSTPVGAGELCARTYVGGPLARHPRIRPARRERPAGRSHPRAGRPRQIIVDLPRSRGSHRRRSASRSSSYRARTPGRSLPPCTASAHTVQEHLKGSVRQVRRAQPTGTGSRAVDPSLTARGATENCLAGERGLGRTMEATRMQPKPRSGPRNPQKRPTLPPG